MSNKEYYLLNVLFVALLFCLFLITGFVDNSNEALSCHVLELTGIECNSCGLTRDFISFAQLDFESPINSQSVFIWIWFVFQLICRSLVIATPSLISSMLKVIDLVISSCTGFAVLLPFWI